MTGRTTLIYLKKEGVDITIIENLFYFLIVT